MIMEIEYEAKFLNIDKNEIRARLKKIGAIVKRPEFLQKRFVFDVPRDDGKDYRWVRVRDEGDKITMTMKIIDGNKIENQKEINLVVDDFAKAEEFLLKLGCRKAGYQENRRELWMIDATCVTIDEWPFLETFIEIEGSSEKIVKEISLRLGFDYGSAVFGGVGGVYMKKYGVPFDIVKKNIEYATFETKNPFLK
jgi:adenylate cyclase class 2